MQENNMIGIANSLAYIRLFLFLAITLTTLLFNSVRAQNNSNSNDINLTVEELNWLSNHETILVGVDPDAAPFEFIDNDGNISGVAGEYLKIIGKKLKVNFVWSGNKDWDQAISFIHSKNADILSTVTPTEERRNFLDFIEVYHTVGSAIFVRSGEQRYSSLQSLSGRKIAQIESFAETEFIQNGYPEIEIIKVSNIMEALQMVSTGKADAHIGNLIIGIRTINNLNLNNIIVGGDSPFKGISNMGLRKDLTYLRSAMQKAINSITEEQDADIAKKWLTLPTKSEIDYALIWRIIIISSTLLLVALLWVLSLRREIKKRIIAERKMAVLKAQAEKAQYFAEYANKAKSDFISNLSHEIRTPLNSMMVFSEAMSDGIYGEIKQKKYHEYLEYIGKSGKHLELVINDILDLSKIEAEKWQLNNEEFDFINCVVEALQILEGKADKKNIKMSLELKNIEPPLIFYGENSSIRRIIINLLSNAIKFSDDNGYVKCTILLDDKQNLIMKIKDNGIGIKEEDLTHILEPFGQVENNLYTKDSGTGLGLAIVKKLVEIHNGQIDIKSEFSKSTTVTITLPKERLIKINIKKKRT